MTAKQITPFVSMNPLSALKPIRFLKTLKRLQFSGQLVLTSSQGQEWLFYLYRGSVMYATGGIHPVRRWHRNLTVNCSQMLANTLAWQDVLAGINTKDFTNCWEYQLLCLWIAAQEITQVQATKIICSCIAEILFDVAQAKSVTHQIKPDNSLSSQLPLIDVDEAIAQVQQLWQAWQEPRIVNYSPNQAPIIKQAKQLQQRSSTDIYQTITKLLDGQRSLRDLAVQTKRDLVALAHLILPYMQLGWVELINISDLPTPVGGEKLQTSPKKESTGMLVACVDDSFQVRHTMEKLLTTAGYRFLGVEDGVRSLGILLTRKPDFIFLDLVMPNSNGYEICTQLRKLSSFRDTPIVILTGNDGFANRLRSNFVGASDFVSKPFDAEKVLNVIDKHLKQGVISH
ncbi:MAG: response regulator [Symploca sp. SIO2G7]|nr:response regulator [Symploca sp. SIO2G7]